MQVSCLTTGGAATSDIFNSRLELTFVPPQVLTDDNDLSVTSSSSLPLLHVPTVHHQLPTMPHFRSQRSALLSQQDRAQRILGKDYGLRPSWSQASVSYFSPLVPTSSPVLSRPSKAPPIASSPYSRLTSMSVPVHNLIRARPRRSRLWVPPAPKVRRDPEAIMKRREREEEQQRSDGSSDSSTQVSVTPESPGRCWSWMMERTIFIYQGDFRCPAAPQNTHTSTNNINTGI